MKKTLFKLLRYVLFLLLGVLIFYLIYRKFNWKEFGSALRGLNYFWIVASILLGLLSNVSRAIRWRMLMKPLGYKPRLFNVFLGVLVMYFANLILPRAGEVVRCTVVTRTDKVPFTKLVGTVFVERLADTLMLFTLAVLIFATNLSVVKRFFISEHEVTAKLLGLLSFRNIVIGISLVVLLIILILAFRKKLKQGSGRGKLAELKDHFIEGIKSIAQMKNKWIFIGHTAFIFLMWLIMLYVVFFAYAPTNDLTLRAGMVAFLMGGLAMLAPINAGMGAWHFMVYETLVLYGISLDNGKIFALIAWMTTNLINIIFGGIALLIVLLVSRRSSNEGLHLMDHDPTEILEVPN